MRKPLFISFILVSTICIGQKNDFTSQFIADSNNFREKSIVFDSAKKVTLVGGKNLKGYSKEEVLNLLGKPNNEDAYNKSFHLTYNISHKVGVPTYLEIYSETTIVTSIFERGNPNDQTISYESYDYKVSFSTKFEVPGESHVLLRSAPILSATIKGSDTLKCHTEDSTLCLKDSNVSLSLYISRYAIFPDTEKEEYITGTVYLSFILGENGSVTNVKIFRGITGGSGINREAVRLISSIPKLIPHKEKGRPVEAKYLIPIRFELR